MSREAQERRAVRGMLVIVLVGVACYSASCQIRSLFSGDADRPALVTPGHASHR